MKFKHIIKRTRYSKTFDPDESIEQAGKKFVLRDKIQKARTDTEIYPTLEKYGNIEKMKMDPNKVYGDFTAVENLRDVMEQQKAALQMWNDLPWEVRKHFNNSVGTFLKEGKVYLKKEIEKEQKAADLTQATATTPNEGEKNES